MGLESLAPERGEQHGLEAYQSLIEALDDLGRSCGVEKLASSTGDYLAVCGLSEERIDHQHRLAEYAVETLQLIERFNVQHETQIKIQIGMASGPVLGALTGATAWAMNYGGLRFNMPNGWPVWGL